MISPVLSRSAVEAATRSLSRDTFYFSPRQLFYELVRASAWPAPTTDPRDERIAFRRALRTFIAEEGPIRWLLSAAEARAAMPPPEAPDLNDYSVRRVLVLDRVETFLVFARNGFHRKMEIALLAFPAAPPELAFPGHVARRLEAQVRRGLGTAFYAVHDATLRGARMRARLANALASLPRARTADVGLTFAQAFRAGIPVRRRRTGERATSAAREHDDVGGPLVHDPEEERLLAIGSYAHLEELPPLELLRWAYERVVRGPEELGFG